MAEISWIKLKTEMFSDEKIRLIESLPEADTILIIWIKLLVQAGKTNANGYIFLNENVPFTAEMLATLFNRPLTVIRLALKTLSDFGMISIDEKGKIFIEGWTKHQNIEGLERIREKNRLRVAKFRENQRLLREKEKSKNRKDKEGNVTCNVTDLENKFDEFRKKYPGTKRGLETEFQDFTKKHKDWKEVIPALSQILDQQIKNRTILKSKKEFVPEWKHLKTWLNHRSWEEEVNTKKEIAIMETNT